MLHKEILVKLHNHRNLSMFRAHNKPGHEKHKHPKIRSYKNGETLNPYYFKDNGDYVAVTPHTGDFALMDFDCHPDYADDWESMSAKECLKLLNEYIKEFESIVPDWKLKVLCQHPSGSGKGVHVWFKRGFNPDNELNGRPRFQGGDLFIGKSYAILYQPVKLWNAVRTKWPLVDELTDTDIEIIKKHRQTQKPSPKPKGVSRKKTDGSFKVEKLPTSQELAERFKDGGDCSLDVMRKFKAVAADYWHETISASPKYDWTPYQLALQLASLPYGFWEDEICRDIAGMALCHVNPDDRRLLDFYKACPCVSSKVADASWEHWQTCARTYAKPVNMGKICSLVRLISQKPRVPVSRSPERIAVKLSMNEFFLSLVPNPAGKVSCSELYQAFNNSSITQKVFIRNFKDSWMKQLGAKPVMIRIGEGRYSKRVNGFSGIALNAKIAGPSVKPLETASAVKKKKKKKIAVTASKRANPNPHQIRKNDKTEKMT